MATPSRRALLRAGVLLVGAAVPLGGARQALSFVVPGTPSGLRRAVFQPMIGTRFLLTGAGGSYFMDLRAVADNGRGRPGDDLRFRLVFEAVGVGPESGTYEFQHPAMRPLDIFVSPIGMKPGVYEAVVDAR